MKFRELNCWELSDDIQGLVYFAQRLDEMLFDYSLDTYKPPALCAPYLCKEAISLIQDIGDSLIDKANLKHVLEELQWAIGNDPVAKSLLDSDLNQYFTVEDNAKLIDRKLKLEVLWRTFNPERYLIACQEQLKEAIKVKSKKTIEVLSRLYISTLINENLSKNVIAEKVEEFFFQGVKGNISSLEQLDDFFKYLFPYFHNFEMVFIADKLINKVKESAKAFKIEIIEELPEGFKEYAIEQDFALQENEVFVLTKKFKAKDVYTAREKAERKLDNLSDLFMVFAHKSKVSWKDKALVRQCCKEGFSIVGKPISSMEKGMDLRPNVASKRLNTMIKNFSVNRESFERFSRVVDLHGMSIVNDIPENQLLNMWIGLETITPTHIGNTKINEMVNELLPFFMLNYSQRLIRNLAFDLVRWNRLKTGKLLNKLPNKEEVKLTHKILELVSLETSKEVLDEFYLELEQFPLLQFRLFKIADSYKNPKSLRKVLALHEKKVSWQIRRIYRTRNIIVHSG